jgi:hypothetical protein
MNNRSMPRRKKQESNDIRRVGGSFYVSLTVRDDLAVGVVVSFVTRFAVCRLPIFEIQIDVS